MDITSVSNPVQPSPGDKNVAAAAQPVVAQPAAAPLETTNPVQPAAIVPTMAQVTQAVTNINKAMNTLSPDLEFSVDDTDDHKIIVKIVDQKTKEVLRQIPSAEALEIAKALDQASQGLLISQKA